jgi:Fe-S-cluster containining protein
MPFPGISEYAAQRPSAISVSGMLCIMRLAEVDKELLRTVDAAFEDAARRAGEWLVCREGCAQCCVGAFAINSLDAMRLKAGMEALRVADPAAAARVEERVRQWVAQYGAEFPGDAASGLLGESDEERDRFEEYANEAPCPALDSAASRCDLYQWRPMTCRVFGPPVRVDDGTALGSCELCFSGADEAEIAACEMAVPHEMEERLLREVGTQGETVVAFALLS